ncbi:uncharacterized protein BKA55DRAFT_679341 [Fusarium redolens]|uniref:Zn(2)-C6 fungal-type domain-containing protein n=1 Tax=Fusarium redolens TaxID=48865 RepID=A0A9P9JY95_FUSRE|nr:uncharacterized protein BKA55DRAFT_679341 [Fusarium redolens]KAH7237090.1 hypothetical protein BKA55DRAFT_679341 [Fusarium redolens]
MPLSGTCKRRRIKCDEGKPQCRNCKIHGASCVYKWMKHTSTAPTNGPSAPQAETHGTEADDLIIFSTRHMMLLHHFTTVTAPTLHSNVTLQAVWEVDVPKIGFRFRFLMDAILALASLHLSYLRPNEWHVHWLRGIELYQTALAGAKAEMQKVSTENHAAIFLFSALTCYFSLARSRCGDTARCSAMEIDEDFLEWVFLFRGTRTFILPPDATSLELGPLAPMIEIGRQRVRRLAELLATDAVEIKALTDLQAEIQGRVTEPTELTAYEGAIHVIWRSFNAVYHQPAE